MRWKDSYGHRHTNANQSATPIETPETPTLQIENARIAAELVGAKALLEAERLRAETAEQDRDRWHAAFLSLPKPTPTPEPKPEPEKARGGLFGLFSGKKNRG